MKIKVCGLKQPENIAAVSALQPDYMGFIYYPKSPRFAATLEAEPLLGLPASVTKTAVFVNESVEQIKTLIDSIGFKAIQLHGDESPEFCAAFYGDVKVLKAFGLHDDFDFSVLNAYQGVVDYFLFDTKTPAHGGSGQTFNWAVLNGYNLDVPFFLSGGISSENLNEVKEIDHPQFYGVDLNSRFEIEPGIKNIEKLRAAFNLLRETNHEIRS